ncbi:MAG: hypothetical protein P0121_11820 [Nitrospira sp.]|nr:hypothetical protein [Nitrospira sp.]
MIKTSKLYYYGRVPLVTSIIALIVLQGCSGPKVSTKTSAQLDRYAISSLVVLPFTAIESPQLIESSDPYMGVPEGAKRSDISPEGIPPPRGRLMQTISSISPHVPERITELVWNRLRNKQGIRVIAPRESMKTAEASPGESETMTEETAASRTAKRLAVDAALIGKVLVYQERVGGPFGASPPAAVGFEVKVISTDGSVLWEGGYYERQRPMNEDFAGGIHRHGRYVTADELAQFGAEELVRAMPFGTSR